MLARRRQLAVRRRVQSPQSLALEARRCAPNAGSFAQRAQSDARKRGPPGTHATDSVCPEVLHARRRDDEGPGDAPRRVVINARTSARGSRYCSGGANRAYDDVRGRAGDVVCSAARIGAASASCAPRRRDGRVARDRPRPGGRTGARDGVAGSDSGPIGARDSVKSKTGAGPAQPTASRARQRRGRDLARCWAAGRGEVVGRDAKAVRTPEVLRSPVMVMRSPAPAPAAAAPPPRT
jgi:hypothetical protein